MTQTNLHLTRFQTALLMEIIVLQNTVFLVTMTRRVLECTGGYIQLFSAMVWRWALCHYPQARIWMAFHCLVGSEYQGRKRHYYQDCYCRQVHEDCHGGLTISNVLLELKSLNHLFTERSHCTAWSSTEVAYQRVRLGGGLAHPTASFSMVPRILRASSHSLLVTSR
jgi:hypothetical protein